MMKNEAPVDLLKKVVRADAPPFLLTRIHARLRAVEPAPASWQWAGALAFSILIALNLYFTQNRFPASCSPAQTLVHQMGLQTSNQLYDE